MEECVEHMLKFAMRPAYNLMVSHTKYKCKRFIVVTVFDSYRYNFINFFKFTGNLFSSTISRQILIIELVVSLWSFREV